MHVFASALSLQFNTSLPILSLLESFSFAPHLLFQTAPSGKRGPAPAVLMVVGAAREEEAAIESSASHPRTALPYTGIHCPAMHWQQHTHNALGDQLLTMICALVSNGLKVAVAVMEKLAPETYHKKACAVGLAEYAPKP